MQTLKVEWWNNHRMKYNKGLVIAGIAAIVITSLLFLSYDNSTDEFLTALWVGSIVYFVYMATLNLIFLILELADRGISNDINQRTKSTAFRLLFWTSVIFPFSYPIFILTMFFTS
ncbi:MAG: hypothetical protein HQ522_18425 [Bacteroidetes bacterium]|nr:hypothetical protein [Bacteroidota bacterium]